MKETKGKSDTPLIEECNYYLEEGVPSDRLYFVVWASSGVEKQLSHGGKEEKKKAGKKRQNCGQEKRTDKDHVKRSERRS